MPVLSTVMLIAAPLAVAFVIFERELKARADKRREWSARITPLIAALKRDRIPWTSDAHVLTFEISGISRTTTLIHAAQDAAGLRFIAPFGCQTHHDSGPTGWGDWHETSLSFFATRCPTCGTTEVTAYAFRPYSDLVSDRGDCRSASLGPRPIAAICLGCHALRGEDGMDADDIAFMQRCREIAVRVSSETSAEGPYR